MRGSERSEICEWDYPFLYNNGKVTFTVVQWNPVGIEETFHHLEFTALIKRMLHYSESLHYWKLTVYVFLYHAFTSVNSDGFYVNAIVNAEYNSNCVTYYYKTAYNIVYKVTVYNLRLY